VTGWKAALAEPGCGVLLPGGHEYCPTAAQGFADDFERAIQPGSPADFGGEQRRALVGRASTGGEYFDATSTEVEGSAGAGLHGAER